MFLIRYFCGYTEPLYPATPLADSHPQTFFESLREAMLLPSYSEHEMDHKAVMQWLDDGFPFFLRNVAWRAKEIMELLDTYASELACDSRVEAQYLKTIYRAQLWTAAIADDVTRIRDLFEEKKLDHSEIDRTCWRTLSHGKQYLGSPRTAASEWAFGDAAATLFRTYDGTKKYPYSKLKAALENSHNSPQQAIRALGLDVEKSPNLKLQCDSIEAPLIVHAARFGRVDIINFLMERYPEDGLLASCDTANGYPVLFHAIECGQAAVVAMLLGKRVDLNKTYKCALSLGDHTSTAEIGALHYAAKCGHLGVMKMMLDHPKIDINAKADIRCSALHFAAWFGQFEVATALLNHPKFIINALDHNGGTALHIAAVKGQLDVAKAMLIHPKFPVNAIDFGRNSALHTAAALGDQDLANALLGHPLFRFNARNSSGRTALHIAAWHGKLDVAKALLNHPKFDINGADNDGNTALHLVVSHGNVDLAKVLLEHPQLDINAKNKAGYTAWHLAAEHGDLEAVRMLLQRGMDAGCKMTGRAQSTALDLAAGKGHTDVVKALLLHAMSRLDAADAREMRRLGFELIKLVKNKELTARSFEKGIQKSLAAALLFYGADEYVTLAIEIGDSAGILEKVFDELAAADKSTVKRLINEIDTRSEADHRIGKKVRIARRGKSLLAFANSIGLD